MNNFSDQQEDNSIDQRPVFLGKRAFKIAAVNPDEAWLKANKFYVGEKEFERTGTMQTKNKPEGTTNRFAKVDVFIKDAFDEPNGPVIKISYMIQERYNISNDGLKCQIINKYGSTLWVPIEEARTLVISNPNIGTYPYVLDGIKPCLVGEESLVSFIRSLRNLNNVRAETSVEDRLKLSSMFEKKDLDKMFSGNFNDISNLLNHGDTTVGFLLGAKTSEKGSVYQDIYRDMPLRPYQVKGNKDEYLVKKVAKDQAESRYSNTYFDLNNTSFRMYVESKDQTTATSKEDLFAGSAVSNGGGFGSASNSADPLGPQSGGFGAMSENDALTAAAFNSGPKEKIQAEYEFQGGSEEAPDDLPF